MVSISVQSRPVGRPRKVSGGSQWSPPITERFLSPRLLFESKFIGHKAERSIHNGYDYTEMHAIQYVCYLRCVQHFL